MTDFRFSPGDLVRLRGTEYDLRGVVDTEARRRYVTANGLLLPRVDVDQGAELIQKANTPHA